MALPRYPELKKSIEDMLSKYFEEKAKEELGPFKDVRRFIQHEGRVLKHNTLDNDTELKELNYQVAKTEYVIKYDEIAKYTPEKVIELLDKQAKEFGGQQAKYQYQVLNDVTHETGNVVDAHNQPLSIELFLETISKIGISFDKSGNPEMPTVVIHPSQTDKWRQLIQEAENDPTVKQRMEEIIQQKREEFDAEQARRKLVD